MYKVCKSPYCECVCLFVLVCREWGTAHTHTHTNTNIHTHLVTHVQSSREVTEAGVHLLTRSGRESQDTYVKLLLGLSLQL